MRGIAIGITCAFPFAIVWGVAHPIAGALVLSLGAFIGYCVFDGEDD